MRQFFTLRFWLTVAALGGLALLAVLIAHNESSKPPAFVDGSVVPAEELRKLDLVSWVYGIQPTPGFAIVDGKTTTDLALVLDGTRTMIIKAGTPGEINCPNYTALTTCTVAADLLGDGVLWFSIIPGVPGATVKLPAVRELIDGGWVRLANGWVVQHAPVVDRNCPEDTASLNDFIKAYGDQATSTFNFEQQEIVQVTCPAAPDETTTTSTTIDPTVTVPVATFPPDTGPLDTSEG